MFQKTFYRLAFAIFLICISGYATSAQKLTEEGKETLKKVKVIRVVAEESYEIADYVRFPFLDYSKQILSYAGFEAVRGDEKTYGYDATLIIRVKGRPLGAYYLNCGRCYFDAELVGELSIMVGDREFFNLPFLHKGKLSPTVIILPGGAENFRNPNNALQDALKETFLPKVLEMLANIKGPYLLIAALKDKDKYIRSGAAKAMGETNDPRFVEPLIAVLNLEYESGPVQMDVAEALRKLTGQNFGNNPTKWQEWYEQNKLK
jgi:hypothetical protein